MSGISLLGHHSAPLALSLKASTLMWGCKWHWCHQPNCGGGGDRATPCTRLLQPSNNPPPKHLDSIWLISKHNLVGYTQPSMIFLYKAFLSKMILNVSWLKKLIRVPIKNEVTYGLGYRNVFIDYSIFNNESLKRQHCHFNGLKFSMRWLWSCIVDRFSHLYCR